MDWPWIIQWLLIIASGYVIFSVVVPLLEAIGLLFGPLMRRFPLCAPPLCLVVSPVSVFAGALLLLCLCRLTGLDPPLIGLVIPSWGIHANDVRRIRAARARVADAVPRGEPTYRLRVRLANEYARLAGDWIGIVAGCTLLGNPALWSLLFGQP